MQIPKEKKQSEVQSGEQIFGGGGSCLQFIIFQLSNIRLADCKPDNYFYYFLIAFLIACGRSTKMYLTSISIIAFAKFVIYVPMFETLSVGRSS